MGDYNSKKSKTKSKAPTPLRGVGSGIIQKNNFVEMGNTSRNDGLGHDSV